MRTSERLRAKDGFTQESAARIEDMLLLVHSLESGGAGAISGAKYDSLRAITNEQVQTEAERLRCLGV